MYEYEFRSGNVGVGMYEWECMSENV